MLKALLLCGLLGWSYGRIFPSPQVDWYQEGQADLNEALYEKPPTTGVAKNVILMIGDGMGLSTVTASRIYHGQKMGQSGEESKLSFETLPNIALSKTFANDAQVTDSASSATAMLSGTKTTFATVGVGPGTIFGDCASMRGQELESILDLSQQQGKSTGFISTTKLTHATVASTYGHTPLRFWQSDGDVPEEARNAGCRDMAYQLVYDNPDINVMLSGGREQFLPNTTPDPEYPDVMGKRTDGRNLFEIWQDMQRQKGRSHSYVWNKSQFDAVNPYTTDYLLGAFEPSYMKYTADRDPYDSEPTLTEMVEKAIAILSKNPNGYFLLIEAGKIDTAHHQNKAHKALEDTVEFSRAAQKVMDLTHEEDTLLIVTADHSHTMTIGGFTKRGNDILGLSVPVPGSESFADATDGLPYTTLGYHNGIGSGLRVDLSGVDTTDKDFRQGIHVPIPVETHAGEDVGVYSRGPMSYLLRSTRNNHYIFHVMAYASCVGPDKRNCMTKPTYPDHQYNNPWECFFMNRNGASSPASSVIHTLLLITTIAFLC